MSNWRAKTIFLTISAVSLAQSLLAGYWAWDALRHARWIGESSFLSSSILSTVCLAIAIMMFNRRNG